MFKDIEWLDENDPRVLNATSFTFSKFSIYHYANDNEIPIENNVYIRIRNTHYHNYEKIKDIIHIVKHNVLSALHPVYSMEFDNNPNVSAFIHIRRGDFKRHALGHAMLPFSFYQYGLNILNTVKEIETIYIISNDIPWCKIQAWDTKKRIVFYDDPDELRTLYLMSRCWAGAVISKSTFSLWGVFLGAYGKTDNIIYSKGNYFLHDLPDTWITI